jgi:hypothetical protein
MNYQSKLSPEIKTVYILSDSQIFQSQTTTVGQVESERSMSVPRILNHHHCPLRLDWVYADYFTR